MLFIQRVIERIKPTILTLLDFLTFYIIFASLTISLITLLAIASKLLLKCAIPPFNISRSWWEQIVDEFH